MKKMSSLLGGLGIMLMVGSGSTWFITRELTLTLQVVGFAGVALLFFYIYMHIDELMTNLGSRSTRYSLFALVLVLLCGGILGMLNFIAHKHPKRYDATVDKRFSLSPQTEQVVKGLKAPVQITAFFSIESQAKDPFKDLMEGYLPLSKMLKVVYIDPYADPTAVKQFQISADGTVVVAQGKNEKRITEATEEALTNALIAVSREGQKKICFLQGHGEKGPDNVEKVGFTEAKAALEKQSFSTTTVQLFQTRTIPPECEVLVAAGPTKPLLDFEKPILDAWVKGGGRLVYMIDPEADPGVADYLKTWGVVARADLVVDPAAQSMVGNAAVPVGLASAPHKITDPLRDIPVLLPLTRSLDKLEPMPNGATVDFLLQTASSEAWGETDPSLLDPAAAASGEPKVPTLDDQDAKGPLNMAALVTFPVNTPGATPEPKEGEEPEKEKKGKQAMVAVFGDSDFASNAYFHSAGNGDLFLNTISFLAEEEDLLSIRAKEASKTPLTLTRAQGDFLWYLTLIVMPGIPLLLGVYVFLSKRNL